MDKIKITFYYFTATGNNLAVARDLAKEVSEDVKLVAITNDENKKMIRDESDIIGIIFPVYLRDIPLIVSEFASRLEVKKNAYVFGVCTYHKDPYNALFNLNTVLKQREISLSAGFHINMPGTSVLVVDFTSTDEENQNRLRLEKEKIRTIAAIIKERKVMGIEGDFNIDEKYESKNYLNNVYKVVEQFWVKENCNLCGICSKVCPRGIIKIKDNKITWDGLCENCQACLHWCPTQAIQNGDNTEKCRRYHHPDIELSEIIKSR